MQAECRGHFYHLSGYKRKQEISGIQLRQLQKRQKEKKEHIIKYKQKKTHEEQGDRVSEASRNERGNPPFVAIVS